MPNWRLDEHKLCKPTWTVCCHFHFCLILKSNSSTAVSCFIPSCRRLHFTLKGDKNWGTCTMGEYVKRRCLCGISSNVLESIETGTIGEHLWSHISYVKILLAKMFNTVSEKSYLSTLIKRYFKKNAFQWDAYRPLVDRIPACTAQGGVCPGGYLSRGVRQTPPPVDRMTDMCKYITLPQLHCGR